jgi:hypothetical protein
MHATAHTMGVQGSGRFLDLCSEPRATALNHGWPKQYCSDITCIAASVCNGVPALYVALIVANHCHAKSELIHSMS